MSASTSMDNPKNRIKGWLERFQCYFTGNLGNFYSRAVNRLTLYPVIFTLFLTECTTFWLIYLGKAFFVKYMSFIWIYSLHKAAVYSICILLADTAAHYLAPVWGAFENRRVGKQWIILTIGLLAGFIAQRTMVNGLIITYAPEVIDYFMAHPEARLSTFELLAYLMPYWCLVMVITLRIAQSKQRIQDQAGSLVILPDRQKKALSEGVTKKQHENGYREMPGGHLTWQTDTGGESIPLNDITHITVEDHYCRINYSNGNRPKSKMIRLPLKEMLLKLPQNHFVRIHRSHVVNTTHVSRIKKIGRDHKAVISHTGTELPISRSCFKNLRPYCFK